MHKTLEQRRSNNGLQPSRLFAGLESLILRLNNAKFNSLSPVVDRYFVCTMTMLVIEDDLVLEAPVIVH